MQAFIPEELENRRHAYRDFDQNRIATFFLLWSVCGTLNFLYAQNCTLGSVGLTALSDLATGYYQGYQGGLYLGGSNERPLTHNLAGLLLATQVKPRDSNGNVDTASGRIVLLSQGTPQPGEGFWLKCPNDTLANVRGIAILRDSMSVAANWNLIGSGSYPVDTSAITTDPASIRRSNYFGYSGGYVIDTTVVPGSGHWVKSSAPGTFILAAPVQ